jgi:FkbM family methyltransferase
MEKTFKTLITQKIEDSLHNHFGLDNYDEEICGKLKIGIKEKYLEIFKKIIHYKSTLKSSPPILKYVDDLQFIWDHLEPRDRNLLVDVVAYRSLGHKKVKLPVNTPSYWDTKEKVESLKYGNDTIDPHFRHFILHRFDLRSIGYTVELYSIAALIVAGFISEQYAYKMNDQYILQAEKGDVVLDVGACWGDTSLYFAHKVGETGKVFSFEFIPGNLKIYKTNMQLNPHLKDRIELVKHPVSDISDKKVYFQDKGPQSVISYDPFEAQTGNTTTITVDDFVDRYNISKVDFIKMDIEGSEPLALKGALNTIKKYRPKLAICIYHSHEDFVNIPKWLIKLNLGYKILLGHHSIYASETVIYANPGNR